jgi:hypothetical protein
MWKAAKAASAARIGRLRSLSAPISARTTIARCHSRSAFVRRLRLRGEGFSHIRGSFASIMRA